MQKCSGGLKVPKMAKKIIGLFHYIKHLHILRILSRKCVTIEQTERI